MTGAARTLCSQCGASILAATAEKNAGKCAPCAAGTREQSEKSRQVFATQEARRRNRLERVQRSPRLPTVEGICEALDGVVSCEDEAQLEVLQVAVESISGVTQPERAVGALLGVFERFPWSDGYGVFWGVLHALEALKEYELALVASVRRRAGEFNLMMVNRLLNGGTTHVGGVRLLELLREVVESPNSEAAARTQAAMYLARHGGA